MKLDDILFFGIRHATTGGNVKGNYRGWSNDAEAQLNEQGRKEAAEAGKYLVSIGAPIKILITDSLDRVQETIEIVSGYFPNARIETVRLLHPLDVGDWTGKSKEKYPVEPYLKEKSKKIPGGESVDDFNQRQDEIFPKILELCKDFPRGGIAVGLHGSNTAYLNNHLFNRGQAKLGYEGLVDPGGVYAATAGGLVPLLKARDKKNKPLDKKLVQISGDKLDRWALLFVGGKDTNREPKSCFNCPHMFSRQKTCEYMGPKIIVDKVKKSGQLYTPVCGYQIGGKPKDTDSPIYLGSKDPDELGLEWAKGTGTNCYGWADGAPCRHFVPTKGEDGICDAMKESDNKVDSDDCCASHLGDSLEWKEAQDLISKEQA